MPYLTEKSPLEQDLALVDDLVLQSAEALNHAAAVLTIEIVL